MTQARIEINGVPGSDDALPINTLVQLSNMDTGGEASYAWSILDQPPGLADSLSATNIENPTLTPKKEGTYLVQLIVNFGLPDEKIDKAVVGIRQLKTLERIPAAGETVEVDLADGWASAMNSLLRRIDALLSDPGSLVGENTSGGVLAHGDVVRVTSGAVIKAGLPGQETVPGFTKALASSLDNMDELLCVVEGDVAGNLGVSAGELAKVRYIGRIATVPLGSGAVGDPVYVGDTATLSVSPGSYRRQVGSIMSVSGGNRDVWFDGVGGADITPIDRAYVLYGSPASGMTNAKRIDGNNATGAVGSVPYTFRAGDAATIALAARRFSAGGSDIFQVQDELGIGLAWFNVLGDLDMNDHRIQNPMFQAQGAGTVPLRVRRFSNIAAADLEQWQNELGTALLKVTSSGALTLIASDLDANTKRVVNLSDPALAQDAATKAYVDPFPIPNYIENGGFDFSQHFETYRTLTAVRYPLGFQADRWGSFLLAAGPTCSTINQPLTTGEYDGSGDLNCFAVRCTAGAPATVFTTQEINRNYMSALDSQATVLTFKAKRTAAGPATLSARVVSANIVGAPGTAAAPDYNVANGHQQDNLNSFALTTSWQTFSLQIPAFRAGTWAVSVQFYCTFGANSATEFVQIRQVMLTRGASSRLWVRRGITVAAEFHHCLEFYEKTYRTGDSPGAVTNLGAHTSSFLPIAIALGQLLPIMNPLFMARKIQTPIIALYSTDGAANRVYDVGAAANRVPAIPVISDKGFVVSSNQGPSSYTPTTPNVCRFHWYANSEYA